MLGFNVETGCYYSTAPSPARSEEKLDIENSCLDNADEEASNQQ